MTSFVRVDYPTQHPGVVRAERLIATVTAVIRGTSASNSAATLLLAAMVSALLVVANQVIDTWTEGHLLAAWITLWTIAFASLALFAAPIGRLVARCRAALARRAAARRQAAEDDVLWEIARTDPRLMADIRRVLAADDGDGARA